MSLLKTTYVMLEGEPLSLHPRSRSQVWLEDAQFISSLRSSGRAWYVQLSLALQTGDRELLEDS